MSSLASAPGRLLSDLLAGVTRRPCACPPAMAYATVAAAGGDGLYTAFVPMVIYAPLGSSRQAQRQLHQHLAIPTATQLDWWYRDGDPGRLLTVTATLTLMVGPC